MGNEDGSSRRREMWNQLPELILTQIFSYLDRNDKANAGQVCQSWNRALSSPVLWRSVTILLDKDLLGQSIADEQAVSAVIYIFFYQSMTFSRLFYKSCLGKIWTTHVET